VSDAPSLPARRTVVVATSNKGKIAELRALFASLPIDWVTVGEAVGRPIEVVEDGDTFEANALKKAKTVAAALAMPALADDSGLCVDALGGRPGVRSARWAGEGATDADNNRKLLAELAAEGREEGRTARFRCVLAFVDPAYPDQPLFAEGAVEGQIALGGRGQGGFGYDPIFLVAGDAAGRTMAELPDAEKNAISHRARAVAAMLPLLSRWCLGG
jgi:XTP/dITP diphosphohydrolase